MKSMGYLRKSKYLLTILGLVLAPITGILICQKFIRDTDFRNKTLSFVCGATYLGTQNVVMQESKNDCGPAALKMIFDYYSIPLSLEELRSKLMSNKGVSMVMIKTLAEANGLKAEGWRYNKYELRYLNLPAIALVRAGHYVVISEIKNNQKVIILDPALGKLEFPFRRFYKIWKGEILTFKKRL
ncbi:MAG: cysteine peptidase family C39 domain-containing protein [Candidatus Saccharicenans sp.]